MQREAAGRGRDAPVRVARAALLANGPLLPAADLPDAGQAGRGPCPPAHARGLQELPAGRGERAGHAAGEQEAGGRGGPSLGGGRRALRRGCGEWGRAADAAEGERQLSAAVRQLGGFLRGAGEDEGYGAEQFHNLVQAH